MPELPLVGDEFAGYRLRAVLGRGGMSVVFRAENPRLGNVIALKVLAPELASDDIFRTRFLEESRIAAAMNHPNVIPIHDMGSSGGLLYLAMRCVNGTDLRQMIKKRGRLPAETAIFLLSQAARALDAAHRDGLVHRDVKPGNLLVERGSDDADPEHLYLADFGITKHVSGRTGLTSTGQFMGTIDYVAPEQIRGISVLGMADQYALGCVLYECLTGRVPFEKDLDAAIMYAHLEEAPTRPTELRPDLPPAVDRVFARVLAKQPGDRYASCREFMAAARDALGPMADKPAADSALHDVHTVLPAAPRPAELVHEDAAPRHDMTESVVLPAARYPDDQGPGGQGPGGHGRDPGGPYGGPQHRRRPSGRGLVIAAVALLLVAGGVTGAVLASSGGRGGSPPAAGGTHPATPASASMSKTATAAPGHTGPTTLAGVLAAANMSTGMAGMSAMDKLPPATCKQPNPSTINCTNPYPPLRITSASFETYASLGALYNAYETEVGALAGTAFRANVSNCGAGQAYGEIGWNHQEAHPGGYTLAEMTSPTIEQQQLQIMGRIACFAVPHSNYYDIVWTSDVGMMLGVAIGKGSPADVYDWWIDIHHNVIFPGTEMCGTADLMKDAPQGNLIPVPDCPASAAAASSPAMTMAPSATSSGTAMPSSMSTSSKTPMP
jgi:serine/threonine protein kinase